MRILLIILIVLFAASNVSADNFGCTALLCLASPDGPMQFEECRPTIKKLYRMLYDRKPFPSCHEADANGVTTQKGYEPWIPCEDGYDLIEKNDAEFGFTTRTCRKLIGYKEVKSYGEGIRKIPVYDQYNQQRRREPFFVEVWHEGEQKGERFWYRLKKKKKKKWF